MKQSAIIIQSYYRGHMVRKKDIINKLKQRVLQQDIAARIIQYYWKQYLKYIGWYDKNINKDLHHE